MFTPFELDAIADAELDLMMKSPRMRALECLARDGGVLMEDLCRATGWRAHSVRSFCSRFGETVVGWPTAQGRRYGFDEQD